MEESRRSGINKGLVIIAVVVIIAVAAVAFGMKQNKEVARKEQPVRSAIEETPQASDSVSEDAAMATLKNGTYSVTGDYTSPGGAEQIGVKITIDDGVITEAEVTPMATRPNSKNFQGIFVANFKPLVVGKKIEDVQLDKVSGSSLTPKGFNDALEKIKAQAES